MREGTIRAVAIAGILGVGLFAPAIAGAKDPEVFTVLEGRDSGSEGPALLVMGKKLTRLVRFDLFDSGGTVLVGSLSPSVKKGERMVLPLPPDIDPGDYLLSLSDKKGSETRFPVQVGNGKPLPGSVGPSSLDAALLADLNDAETLNGEDGLFYRDAGNLTGVLGTGLFSAYGDLVAEGKIGTGPTQVPRGDHDHGGTYSALGHGHAEYLTKTEAQTTYSPLGHDHDSAYSKKALVGAKVYLSVDQVIPPDQLTKIAFDSEAFDTDDCHDNTLNPERVFCNTAGFYLVGARLSLSLDALNPDIRIRKNGTTAAVLSVAQNVWFYGPFETTTVLPLAEGDYLEFEFLHENGQGNRLAKSGEGFTEFWMVRIGE